MSSSYLENGHILGDMSLVGMRKVRIRRGLDCQLLLIAGCDLCPCFCHSCPGPSSCLMCSSDPHLLPVSVLYFWVSHTGSCPLLPSQVPFQVPYLLASLFSATHSSVGQLLRTCWHSEHLIRQQTINVSAVIAVPFPPQTANPRASPDPVGMVSAT